MEGTTRLAGSHSRAAPPPPSSTASGVKPFAPHAEQYSEIFESFRSGKACSIPMLDLPPFHDSLSAFDLVGCSGFVYSEIFGGFSFSDFALPYDELFRPLDSQDSSDDWTKVGKKSLSDKPDPSACSGRNQHFMNGDFHQTTVNKFNVSYNKVNTETPKDSNMIHVPELGAILGNSYIYEGSTLQEDVEETYSSGVVDDVIFHEDPSGITTAIQSTTKYVLSDGSDRKDGRPHQINLSPTAITVSDVSLTTEPSHVPQTSRSPPTDVDRKKISVSSMPENEHPKSNVANSLFDIGSLHFLNLELNTGSSDIASAEAIKEAMDRATVKLKSSRGSVERENDATKGTRPVTKHDMNGDVKMRMFYDESVVSHDELLPKHENKFDLFKIHGKGVQDVSEASHVLPDHFQVENATNGVCTKNETEGRKRSVFPTDDTCAVLIEALEQKEDQGKSAMRENQESHFWLKKPDEESRKKENVMCEEEECETKLTEAQKTKHCEKNMEEATLSDCYEKKLKPYVEMEKFDKLEGTTENDRGEKIIDAAHGQLERSDNTGKIKDGVADEMKRPVNTSEPGIFQTMYEDSVTNEEKMMDKGDLDPQLRNTEQERELEKEQINNLEEEREKRLRLHHKKVAEFREKEREKEMEKNCLEEEKQWERDLEKDCLRKLDNGWEWEREKEKEQVNNLEEEREKRLRLHHKKVAEFREKEREKEMEKNCLEEEKQWERDLEKDCLRKLDNGWEWEREKEKDRMGAELNPFAVNERTSSEALEREDRVAVERGTAAARQRAVAEARERLEKACAEAREKSVSEKASTEARLREERVAVARTTVEARERATEKTMAERATFEVWGRVERSASANFSSPSRDIGFRHSPSSSDLWNPDKSDEIERESANRCRARLERHCRTVERVAKALAEKNTRDLIAQTEQAEKNRLAESLDADIKRWSNGKEGNLRALLSTLQYIIGPDSGWHPIPLTEVITCTAVKKAYRKATLCVHPDKLQQRGASIQQRYICEKVFDLLKDAWKKFDSVER